MNAPASFERTERSAANDHFGWHPRTGPDVDAREGHVFVGNLLVALAGYAKPLLRFEQPAALCARLTRPQVKGLDGNLYLRESAGRQPLVLWGPVSGTNCQVGFDSLEDLRKAAPQFEGRGLSVTGHASALFRSLALRNYDLAQIPPGVPRAADIPEDVRRALGWTEGTFYPGAYPSPLDPGPVLPLIVSDDLVLPNLQAVRPAGPVRRHVVPAQPR